VLGTTPKARNHGLAEHLDAIQYGTLTYDISPERYDLPLALLDDAYLYVDSFMFTEPPVDILTTVSTSWKTKQKCMCEAYLQVKLVSYEG
jgi:hypothetical protein